MKTLIAIPCMDTVQTQFTRCLVDLTRTAPPDTSVCFKQSSLIYDSRNLLALTAIENNYDRVLWLDSDMIFPTDVLTRLHSDMDKGYDMVSGLYVKRGGNIIPVLWKQIDPPEKHNNDIRKCIIDYLDYPQNTLFDIAGSGFGCVMTSVKLLKDIFDKYGPAFSPFVWAGEDISFCYRAGLIGARIACDTTFKLGHIGNVTFTEDIFLKNRGDQH